MLLLLATSTERDGVDGVKAPTMSTVHFTSLPLGRRPRIVVVPGAIAVTTPFLFTLAIAVLSEYQRKLDFMNVLPGLL